MSDLKKDKIKQIKNDFDKKLSILTKSKNDLLSEYKIKLEEKKIQQLRDQIKNS